VSKLNIQLQQCSTSKAITEQLCESMQVLTSYQIVLTSYQIVLTSYQIVLTSYQIVLTSYQIVLTYTSRYLYINI